MKGYHYLLIGAGAVLIWRWAQGAKTDPGVPPPPKGAGIFGPIDDFLDWAFPGMMSRGKTIPTFGDPAVSSPPFPD